MSEKQYHHGDLRQELIRQGLQLLAEEGYDGFSMRKLAALCGVSHAAPYKHFQSKEQIIGTIAAGIADEFDAALVQAVQQHAADPRLQLLQMCRQYVKFLVEHPEYFRFIFMTAHGRPIAVGLEEIVAGSRRPLEVALQCAEQYFRPLHGDGWRQDFLAVWSMLQGYVLMLNCQTIQLDADYLQTVQGMIEGYLRDGCE